MKDFKHTHKMHHGAHPVFGGGARPAMQSAGMPPMMPPGGMGGIQSAGEDMASSAPGGMSGGSPSGMGGGADAGSSGAGYRRGGKIMKKARGGEARDGQDDDEVGTIRMEKMPSGAQQYIRGKNRNAKNDTINEYTTNAIDDMNPGSDDFMEQFKKADKLINARGDNTDAHYNEAMQGLKKGGMAKGGNWIKGAIKHPGALHRQLGVPMGQKIPAKKLEKATHSSNPTLAKRARLAKTLRGFK